MARKPTLLRRVTAVALEAGRRCLADYSHPKSPRRYTQPQLLACLVLKAYLKQTYRGIIEILQESDGLREALDLTQDHIPRHTTLEEFASRLGGAEVIDQIVAECLKIDGRPVTDLATDSTGLQSSAASAHYLSRTGKKGGHYLKLSLAVACMSILLVGFVVSRGPSHDLQEAKALDWRSASRVRPLRIYKDAGYDSEWSHIFWREGCSASSFIPPFARGSAGVIKSPFRSQMAKQGMPLCYGKRWHAESFISGLKRSTGDKLLGKTHASQSVEAALRLLAYQCRRI